MERFDTARLYLYRVLPWSPLGDPAAFINLMWTYQAPGYNKPAWRGVPCQSIEECITSIQRAQRNPKVKDIYVCMSSQKEYEVRDGNGGQYKIAKRSQTNAVQLRTLFADIDVKEGAYPTTKDALVAFKGFLGSSGMPQPNLLVASGSGGFHAYWTMDKALSVAEWQPLANALAEALRRHGVKADTACTIDAARVLRVPETYNTKTTPATTVQLALNSVLPHDYTVDQLRQVLAPYMGAQVIPLNPRGNANATHSALSAGIETPQAPLINIQTVADAGCGFIREALGAGGKDYSNPLWNLTTLTAVFTEGGREDAHRMAKGHQDYTVETTDELFDRKVNEKEVKNLGWPSCQTVELSGCASCATCPLKGPATRPLQFGRPTPTVQDPLGDLPWSYSRNPQGYIMRDQKTKDGGIIQVKASEHVIGKAWMQDDPWGIHFLARTDPGKDSFRQISVTIEQANSTESFNRVVGKQGIALNPDMSKEFRGFVVAWMTQLQKTKDAVVSSAPYGWVETNGKLEGFAYGGRIWTGNGDRPAGATDMEIGRQYKAQGELDPWKRAAKMVTDLKSPSRDAMLSCAFAGPLVQFTGLEGLLVNAYSVGSGFGKTSIMKVAQAVWARPAIALNGLTDTTKSTFGKAATLKNIPLFWDEIKSEQDKIRFADIAFQLSAGTDTARMAQDTSLRRRGEWKTLVISACNDSILEVIGRQIKSTTAGVHRVFEFTLDAPRFAISGALADQHVLAVQANYGNAGLEYAKWLGANVDAIHKDVSDVRETLEKKLEARSDERFWVCAVVCLFLGARYANRLGLTEIDEKALLGFLLGEFKRLRTQVNGSEIDLSSRKSNTSVLGAFLADMRARHTIKTNRMWLRPGKPAIGEVKVFTDTSRVETLHVHIATESGKIRFSQRAFRDWLERNHYSITAVEGFLKANMSMVSHFARLGAGTDLSTLQLNLFEVDMKDVD